VPEAFIVDAVRTPVGKRGGSLAGVHSADLGAHVLSALVGRTGVDPGAVDDVVMGCCDTIGSQAGDVARTAWLVAGLPDHVPGVTIDRQCGSSQQAVHFAAQGVMSGTQDLVVKIGIHEGPCLAVMLNDRQDYFGQTVNIAARVQSLSTSQEIHITGPINDAPAVAAIFKRESIIPIQKQAALRGIADKIVVYEIR